jgi:TatD DNase family protein
LNGIMTFTKDEQQLEAAKLIPLDKLILETDAPFLTPAPFRGQVCEPKHVLNTAEFLAELRGESLEDLATQTTQNAIKLFGLDK